MPRAPAVKRAPSRHVAGIHACNDRGRPGWSIAGGAKAAASGGGARRGGARAGLRRLPHRPAHHRRRAADPPPHDRAGARGRWTRGGARTTGQALRDRPAHRDSMARAGLRQLRVLRHRPRESLRPRGLHRIRPRRRICRVHGGRRSLLLRLASPLRRRARGAAAVRRPDRLSLLAAGGRGNAAPTGPVRVWRGSAHRLPDCRGARAGRLRLHATRRLCRPGVRALIGNASGPAAPTRRRRCRWMQR